MIAKQKYNHKIPLQLQNTIKKYKYENKNQNAEKQFSKLKADK